MSLSDKTVLELKEILKEDFDIECTQADASETAVSLVSYAEILLEIDKQYGDTPHRP